MAKFLDKKERVFDIKLTTYGRHLLSRGTFKPSYYAFFDSEILYDKDYARSGDPASQVRTNIQLSGTAEPQNDIHERIKRNTQYIESFVNFREVEETPEYLFLNNDLWEGFGSITSGRGLMAKSELESMELAGITTYIEAAEAAGDDSSEVLAELVSSDEYLGEYIGMGPKQSELYLSYMPFGGDPRVDLGAFFDAKVTPDFFRFESSIGDAAFDGKEQQHAPAWKVVTLQGQISSSASEDISHFYVNSEGRNEQKIPQVNIDLNYVKKVQEEDTVANPNNIPQLVSRTSPFADNNIIELVRDDLVIYADEINTLLQTENFDIEVFESNDIDTPLPATGRIIRKNGYGPATAGNTITINDGVTSATFEFIVDGGTPAEGNIGVVISADYDYFAPPGGANDRFGTMENLVAAINQSDNTGWEDGGLTGIGRCGGSIPKCYTGTHTLNVTANDGDHSLEWLTPVSEVTAASWIVINITNHVGGTIANELITKVGDAGWDISGFSGGRNKITTQLTRKYFQKEEPQIVNGMMVRANKKRNTSTELTNDAVEYYFDIFTDDVVDRDLACRGANIFNKDSYYVDLDFECQPEELCKDDDLILYDIYGNAIGDTSDIC